MKIKQVIYNYRDFLDKEQISFTEGSSNRWVYNHLLSFRSFVLTKKRYVDKVTEQSMQLLNIPLIQVQDSEFKCIKDNNCIIMRTKEPVPEFVKLYSITSPFNSEYVTKFEKINPTQIQYKKHSRYPSDDKVIFYYIQDTGNGLHMYFYSQSIDIVNLKNINFKAIFYDPAIVSSINCDGLIDSCSNFLEKDFKIDNDLLLEVYNLSINSIMRPKNQFSDYNQNNNSNSPQIEAQFTK